MIRQLATIAVTMITLDAIWLTLTAASSHQVIAALQGKPLQIRWIPTALVYILMIAATWFFAVEPATDWKDAAGRGALLGFSMSGLYDITNYATLQKWPLDFAIRDTVWGTILFAVVAMTTTLTSR